MSAIRAYLEDKAHHSLGEKEWLRREPQETHPAILTAVREALEEIPPSAGGTIYDDDVERYVNRAAGDLPPHLIHAHPGRHRLVEQLSHEVYIARKCIRDEESAAALNAALEDGYEPLSFASLEDGERLLIRFGTLYSGYSVPVYAAPRKVRVRLQGTQAVFLPNGARTRGFVASGPALVKRVPA